MNGKKHTRRRLMCLILVLCFLVPLFNVAPVFADEGGVPPTTPLPAPNPAEPSLDININVGITPQELDAMALDPQGWKLGRDMGWDQLKPNPVVDWLTDKEVEPEVILKGAIVLVEFPDRKFIVRGELGSDKFANPLIGGANTDEKLRKLWCEFLEIPSADNNFRSIDSYWKENTYGKQGLTLEAFGPYDLSRFEFQYSSLGITAVQRFDTIFPRGAGLATEAYNLAKADGVQFFTETGEPKYDFLFFIHAGYSPSSLWQPLGEMMFLNPSDIDDQFSAMARLNEIEAQISAPGFDMEKDYPGFYLLNPTYNAANTTAAYASYKSLYFESEYAIALEATPGLTEAAFETSTFRPAFDAKFASSEGRAEIALPILKEHIRLAKLDAADPNIGNTQGSGANIFTAPNPNMRWAGTRYVPWTSWFASMTFWTTEGTLTDSAFGHTWSISTQAENDSFGTFVHEFGHIRGLPDIYNSPYTLPMVRSYMGPWDLMSRGSGNGAGGWHQGYQVPSTTGRGSSPPNQILYGKMRNHFTNAGDIIDVTVDELKSNGPAFAEIVARNIPTNNDAIDYGVDGKRGFRLTGFVDKTPRDNNTLDPFTTEAGNLMNFPDVPRAFIDPEKWNWGTYKNANPALVHESYTIEVIDRTGYDSFCPDSGVMIAKNVREGESASGATVQMTPYEQNYHANTWLIDAHPGALGIPDFVRPNGERAEMTDGDQHQLAAALFHAGLHNDPNYGDTFTGMEMYGNVFDGHNHWKLDEPIVTKVAGHTVNEWVDEFNDLHFYILNKNLNPAKNGKYLSYDIAVRSTADDAKKIDGTLTLQPIGGPTPASTGNFSKQVYALTNTGSETDIVRIAFGGSMYNAGPTVATGQQNAVLLNNLYAVEAGKTIEIEVYIKNLGQVTAPFDTSEILTITASSETNEAKTVTLNGPVLPEIIGVHSMNTVLGKEPVWRTEDGKTAKTPISAGILGGDNAAITAADIGIRNSGSTVALYTDDTYATAATSVALPNSATTPVYFTITSGDGASTVFFKVNVVRGTYPVVGNKFLQENMEKYPDLFDYEKGQTRPIFATNADRDRLICEEVWIEVPVDVDGDGKRDLVRAQFKRPLETRPEYGGLMTPVTAELTPYASTYSALAGPLGGKVDIDFPGANNPDTRNVKYEDLRYTGFRYKDLLDPVSGNIMQTGLLEKWGIPDARIPLGSQTEGNPTPFWSNRSSAWQTYFLPLGYTNAYLTIIGSDFGEGFLTYGDYAENLASAALVDWLNGRVKGYSDPVNLIEVEAPYWATGEVSMAGRSYGGTLPFAAAITGVEGLRTIIPSAPVTSSYEYYRSNGAVYSPGDCQGEDISDIIAHCFGRGWSNWTTSNTNPAAPASPTYSTFNENAWDPPKTLLERFYEYIDVAYWAQDRETGDYSAYWDARNQVSFMDDIRDDLGILMIHGFNDNNVKFKNTALVHEMAKELGLTYKGIYHQGRHVTFDNHDGYDFYPLMHLWQDYYLYGVENGMPDAYPEVQVQSNVDISFKEYPTWPMGEYQKLYPAGSGRVGELRLNPQSATSELPFKDTFIYDLERPVQLVSAAPQWDTLYAAAAAKYDGHCRVQMSAAQGSRWRNYMLGGGDITTGWTNNWTAPVGVKYDLTKALDDRLLYVMNVTQDITISGAIKMTAKVAADKNVGYISAMLVDIGDELRYGSSEDITNNIVAPDGSRVDLRSFRKDAELTPGRIIARGSVDVQNPNFDGKLWNDAIDQNFMPNFTFQTTAIEPGTFYPYTFEMNVMEYTVQKGHKLVLLIFGADPEYTIRPKTASAATGFKVEIGPDTYLSLPLVAQIPLPPPPPAAYEITFDLNYTGAPAPKVAITDPDGMLPTEEIPADPTRTDYRFDGWFDATEGGDKVETTDVFAGDMTLYARWTFIELPVIPETYEITFDLNYTGAPAPKVVETDPDGMLPTEEIPADPTRTDYRFDGWFDATEGGDKVETTDVFAGDMTLYAHWTFTAPPVYTDPDTPAQTYRLEPEESACTDVPTAEVTPTVPGETGQEEAADAVADLAENWASDVEQVGPAIEVKLPKKEPTVVTLASLPEDLDPADVTVMAILNDDGTLTPVPTRIVGGKVVVILLEDAILVPLAVSATFGDMAHVSEAVRNEIMKAAALAIVEGFPGGDFKPSEQVTVQQAVAMFLRAAGVKVDYATAMATGVEYKFIAEGMTAGAAMTRIQAAQLIVNMMVHFGHTCALTEELIDDYLASFPDVDELSAAEQKALASCVMHGIFKGHTDGTIRPGEVLNRSQMASLAVRVQEVLFTGQ